MHVLRYVGHDDVVVYPLHHRLDGADEAARRGVLGAAVAVPPCAVEEDGYEQGRVDEQGQGVLGERDVERTHLLAADHLHDLAVVVAAACYAEALVRPFAVQQVARREDVPSRLARVDDDGQIERHVGLAYRGEVPVVGVHDVAEDHARDVRRFGGGLVPVRAFIVRRLAVRHSGTRRLRHEAEAHQQHEAEARYIFKAVHFLFLCFLYGFRARRPHDVLPPSRSV